MDVLQDAIFNSVIQQGAFAGLFVWLLITTQKKNETREDKYQQTIEKNQEVIETQANAFGSLSKDVTEIKQKLFEGDGK